MSPVPVATSPGRSGFGPALTLSNDFGRGNGLFGFGWLLALPSVTRKTDKGLPRYDAAAESDVFLVFDAEDLVPARDPGAGLGTGEPDRVRLPRRPVPAAGRRGCSPGSNAGPGWPTVTRTGGRSPGTTSPPCTAFAAFLPDIAAGVAKKAGASETVVGHVGVGAASPPEA